MRKNLTKFLLLTIAFTFALSINYIFAAWIGPTQTPPLGNTPTPVNVGSIAQVKDGGLSLNSLAVFGNGYFQDNIGIGTVAPDEALHVNGNIKIVDGNQGTGKVLTSDANGVGSWLAGAGKIVQMVYFQTGEFASSPKKMAYEDIIPQNTEGEEYMSLTITPTSVNSILEITVVVNATSNDNTPTVALFQDNQVNAIAATYFVGYPQWITPVTINHFMQAGTTSATTFKVRMGSSNGNTYFNGQTSGRMLGGVYSSSITIKEYSP